MNPLSVSLNDIRKHKPCASGWSKLLNHLGKTKADDEPVSLITILNSNGIDDAIWCLRALPKEYDRTIRLFAVACAREVEYLNPDPRVKACNDTAERYANGLATKEELDAAWAARAAAGAAARAAAWAAARAAAGAAAWAATWAAAKSKQSELFIKYFS